jgi:hypothetical protein
MNCTEIRNQLGPYVDGEVSPEVRRGVDAHVRECDACRIELGEMRTLVASLARPPSPVVPGDLWGTITQRLDEKRGVRATLQRALRSRRTLGLAAMVIVAVGLGLFTLPWAGDGVAAVEAATVDFGQLLDQMHADPQAAYESFLGTYAARPITAAEAHRYAPQLSFDLPAVLPGGFHLTAVYALRFGDNAGITARYTCGDEFLAVVFHPPVLREQYGTHKDYHCIVGEHRGHRVAVGDWTLVHLTDPSTCHCVLSRLSEDTELPDVMAAIAPAARQSVAGEHEGDTHTHEP